MKLPDFVALTCKEVTELTTDYMSSQLSAEDRACFEQHLHACTWCMTHLVQLRRTVDWTKQLAAPAAPEAHEAMRALFRRWKQGQTP